MGFYLYSTRTRARSATRYVSRAHAFRDLDTMRKVPGCGWDVVVAANLTRARRPVVSSVSN